MTWLQLKAFYFRVIGIVSLTVVYSWWSRLYRLLWEFPYHNYSVKTYRTIADLDIVMSTCKYLPDGIKQLGDAISYPGRVQFIIDHWPEDTRLIGDCDEFAIYEVNAIEASLAAGCLAAYDGLTVKSAKFMTVNWLDSTGKFDGHNVCLIEWLNGTFSYLDYTQPSDPCADVGGVLKQIETTYFPGGLRLSWSIHDKDLRFVEVHW